jgi:hypothetical protein
MTIVKPLLLFFPFSVCPLLFFVFSFVIVLTFPSCKTHTFFCSCFHFFFLECEPLFFMWFSPVSFSPPPPASQCSFLRQHSSLFPACRLYPLLFSFLSPAFTFFVCWLISLPAIVSSYHVGGSVRPFLHLLVSVATAVTRGVLCRGCFVKWTQPFFFPVG